MKMSDHPHSGEDGQQGDLASRPHLCQLIDNGEFHAEYVGTHRKIRFDELTAYVDRRRSGRRAALNDVARVARAADQYADDF